MLLRKLRLEEEKAAACLPTAYKIIPAEMCLF